MAGSNGRAYPGRDVGRSTMFARIGVMRAFNGKPDPAIVPQGKRAEVYKVIR